jgi:hypothetical protein
MSERLEIHECSIEFCDNDSDDIAVGGWVVWDSLAGMCRWASLSRASCQRWIENHGHEYPDTDDEDGLS